MAARSLAEKRFDIRLNAFHITLYENETLSTGKLLSNMQRAGVNFSMHHVRNGAIEAASSSEPIGFSRVCQSKPQRTMPRPPSLITTLGHAATAAMPLRHVSITSSRFEYGPVRSKPPT